MLTLKIIAVVLAIAGIVGSIVPALPGPPLSWVAMLCVYFCEGADSSGEPMTLACLLIWLVITVIITVLDYIVPSYMTKATGGHKAASRGAGRICHSLSLLNFTISAHCNNTCTLRTG